MAALLADNIFRSIFVNEKFCILIKISLKFVAKGPLDNNPALVYWDNSFTLKWQAIKALSEPMLTWFTDAYMRP